MNKNNIIEWIDNPATVNEDATRELREIIQEFPASPILHWLYLKGLQNQKSYLFNSALTRAAIGSPNRSQLLKWVGLEQPEVEETKKQRFDFVIPEIEKEEIAEVHADVKVTPIVEEEQTKIQIAAEEIALPEVEEKKPERKIEVAQPKKVEVKKKAPADLPDDIKALLEKSKRIRMGISDVQLKEEVKPEPEDFIIAESEAAVEPLKEEWLNTEIKEESTFEAVSGQSPSLTPRPFEDKEVPIEEVVSKATVQTEALHLAKETYFSIDLDVDISESFVEKTEIEPTEVKLEKSFSIELEDYGTQDEYSELDLSVSEIQDEKESTDFTSWLKALKSEKSKPIPKIKPTLKEEISFEIKTEVALDKPEKVDSGREKKIELIDKFLIERPKITPRKEDFSSLNIADNPESSDNQFVTETLAKVYLAQGYINKAIEAYEILGLKYPEKNSFFADRIREIKGRK